MEHLAQLLEKHIGQWIAIYVVGSFANMVGGKLTQVSPHHVVLDQDNDFAYVPMDRIVYLTFPKET